MKSPILATLAVAALGVLSATGEAQAQTATDTFEVRARVVKTCTVVANDLDFGVYVSTQAARASTTMSVQCTPDTPFTIEIGGGGASNRGDRRMSGPASLRYGLYKDGGYTQPTATSGTDFAGRSDPQGTALSYQVYGQIVANQAVPAGNYLDTVTVTVTVTVIVTY